MAKYTLTPMDKRIFALCNQLALTEPRRMELIAKETGQRTSSIKEMEALEKRMLIKRLEDMVGIELSKMRGKVLHYFQCMGYVNDGGTVDYRAMNQVIKNIGTNNPKKKQLFDLNKTELKDITTQVEMMYKKKLNL